MITLILTIRLPRSISTSRQELKFAKCIQHATPHNFRLLPKIIKSISCPLLPGTAPRILRYPCARLRLILTLFQRIISLREWTRKWTTTSINSKFMTWSTIYLYNAPQTTTKWGKVLTSSDSRERYSRILQDSFVSIFQIRLSSPQPELISCSGSAFKTSVRTQSISIRTQNWPNSIKYLMTALYSTTFPRMWMSSKWSTGSIKIPKRTICWLKLMKTCLWLSCIRIKTTWLLWRLP